MRISEICEPEVVGFAVGSSSAELWAINRPLTSAEYGVRHIAHARSVLILSTDLARLHQQAAAAIDPPMHSTGSRFRVVVQQAS